MCCATEVPVRCSHAKYLRRSVMSYSTYASIYHKKKSLRAALVWKSHSGCDIAAKKIDICARLDSEGPTNAISTLPEPKKKKREFCLRRQFSIVVFAVLSDKNLAGRKTRSRGSVFVAVFAAVVACHYKKSEKFTPCGTFPYALLIRFSPGGNPNLTLDGKPQPSLRERGREW